MINLFNHLKRIVLCFICFASGMGAATGCKDYDEEICGVEDRIGQTARDLEDLKSKLAGDPVWDVSFSDGTLRVTTHSGTVSYAIGADTPLFDVQPDGTRVIVNGVSAGEVAGGGTPEKIDLLEDGTVVADGIEQSFGAIPEADRERYIALIRNAGGRVVAAKIKEGTVYAPLDLEPSPVIASLTYIPTHAEGLLGHVAFFPVIVYDEYSQMEQAPVFGYNDAGRELHESLVAGWLSLRYRVNPTHVDPAAIEHIAFDHTAAVVSAQSRGTASRMVLSHGAASRGAPDGLEIRSGAKIAEGVLDVQVRGLRMFKWSGNGDPMPGSGYDDPKGVPTDPGYGEDTYQADLLSLRATHRENAHTGSGNVVSADYVAVKRLVVSQRDIEIGLAVEQDGRTPCSAFRDLSDMYTGTERRIAFSIAPENFDSGVVVPDPETTWDPVSHSINTNVYKIAMPVQLQVPYWENLHEEGRAYDVDAVMRSYFTRYATNTGHVSGVKQYGFDDFGFGDVLQRRYFVEGYQTGHTDPSTGAPIYSGSEVMKYMRLTADGKISFHAGNTASIDRRPIIRVELRDAETDRLVMTKLLKIRIADHAQRDTVLTVGHVTDQSIPQSTTDGTELPGWYIDLDAAYNAAGMSKANFQIAYGTDPEITVAREGQPVTQDVTFALVAPIRQRIAMTLTPDALPGAYTVAVKYTLSPGNPTAACRTITIHNAFTLSQP